MFSVDSYTHQIKELGLTAPNKKNEVEGFIKTLEGKINELVTQHAKDQK